MARPRKPPFLNPRQPVRALTWSMQKAREVHGWEGKQTAEAFGCSPAHISRVEHGAMPSRSLVIFYDETFEMDGQLMSLYEVAIEGGEQDRRRYGGRRPPPFLRKLPGDESAFVGEDVPNGRCFEPGELFTKTWQIRNSGSVPWRGRRDPGAAQSPDLRLHFHRLLQDGRCPRTSVLPKPLPDGAGGHRAGGGAGAGCGGITSQTRRGLHPPDRCRPTCVSALEGAIAALSKTLHGTTTALTASDATYEMCELGVASVVFSTPPSHVGRVRPQFVTANAVTTQAVKQTAQKLSRSA